MYQPVLNKIKEVLEREVEEDEINKENYIEISSYPFENKKCCFIDGGSTLLFDAPHFAVGVMRISSVTFYQNKKKIIRKEYFCVFEREENINITLFQTNTDKKETFVIEDDEFENTLTKIMRVKEWHLAKESDADYLFLDGTFDEKDNFIKINKQYIVDIKIPVIGLAKTNTLMLKNNSFTSTVNKNSKFNTWYYKIGQNKFICKLHKLSNYVFVLEGFNINDEAFGILKEFSKDPTFLGYPYGLTFVDQITRITNEEKQHFITQLSVKLGKDYSKLLSYSNNKNAHSVLDKMQF